MKTDKYIANLLFDHDCVIVPGFGGFVANYQPARIDEVKNKFSPPSKKISFNKNLKNNDGLLINAIAEGEKTTYDRANSILQEEVSRKNKSLISENRVTLNKIGTLYYDSNRNLRFEQDNSVNYLRNSFGLPDFYSLPVPENKTRAISEKAIEISGNSSIKQVREHQARKHPAGSGVKRLLPYALALLPVIAYLVWLPLETNILKKSDFHYSELNPFTEKVCEIYHPRKEKIMEMGEPKIAPLISSADTSTYIQLSFVDTDAHSVDPVVVKLKEGRKVGKKPSPLTAGRNKFHVVGGCFQYFDNAQNFVNRLKKLGFDAHIMGKRKGLYCVSFQSFANREDAVDMLAAVRQQENPNAWLLIK